MYSSNRFWNDPERIKTSVTYVFQNMHCHRSGEPEWQSNLEAVRHQLASDRLNVMWNIWSESLITIITDALPALIFDAMVM